MGSFRAALELGGKEFDVLATEYAFSRDTDKKGKISSNVYGGRINITIESTSDTSVIEAMLNSQFKSVEGKIIFKKSEEDAKMKEVEFRNGYIVYYKENLNVNGDIPMTINFTISAEEMTIGNATIDNRWPAM
ncbi:type VI secretion system tube protein TssD [Aquimarina sp. 2-A2]|uniref:type VI secretion system tube protein TssD n=1 Tax=Aquimarina sp. 2-A2 TaxID=3382644 RepID=UPI00387F02D7